MDNQNDHERQLRGLEDVLHDLIQGHEAFRSLLQQKRKALSEAKHDRVMELLEQENASIQAISDLEKKRLQIVAELTLAYVPQARAPMRLHQLAHHLPEPARGRLLVLRERLRDRMQNVQQETGVARRATERLVRHMQGLVHTLGAVCCGAGVYERSGTMPNESGTLSTFHTTA